MCSPYDNNQPSIFLHQNHHWNHSKFARIVYTLIIFTWTVKSTQIYLDDFLYYITVATVTYSYSITTTAMQYCPNQLKPQRFWSGWSIRQNCGPPHRTWIQTAIIYNEVSTTLKKKIVKNDIAYQLVPPGTQLRNASERAIQTYYNHFTTFLCRLDPNFPVQVWGCLVPHG